MSFRQGVSTSPSNLLTQLANFITTIGGNWSVIRSNGAGGDPATSQLTIEDTSQAVGSFWSMEPNNTDGVINMQPHTADSGAGVTFENHTGSPNTTGNNGTFVRMGTGVNFTQDQGFVGPHTQFFFFEDSTSDGAYLHIAVEGTAGIYFHMWMGTIEKAGTFDGGQYAAGCTAGSSATGTMWAGQFNPPTTSSTQWFRADSVFSSGTPGWREMNWFAHYRGGSTKLGAFSYEGGLNEWNQRTPLGPILAPFWASNTVSASVTQYIVAGHIPDMRYVSMDGREPGDLLTLGSDSWHLFPVHRKTTDGTSSTTSAYTNTHAGTGPAPRDDSNLAGYAYREVGPTV